MISIRRRDECGILLNFLIGALRLDLLSITNSPLLSLLGISVKQELESFSFVHSNQNISLHRTGMLMNESINCFNIFSRFKKGLKGDYI